MKSIGRGIASSLIVVIAGLSTGLPSAFAEPTPAPAPPRPAGAKTAPAKPAITKPAGAKPADIRAPIAIKLDNSATELTADGDAIYTIKVKNNGKAAYPKAIISQLLPGALKYVSGEPKVLRAAINQVQWQSDLPAGKEVLLKFIGKVGLQEEVHQVKGKARLTTTACVAPDEKSRLAACSSDSDAVMASSLLSQSWAMPAGVALSVLASGAAAVFLLRRRAIARARTS